MTKFRTIVFLLGCLVMITSSEVINISSKFVWTPDPCEGGVCDQRKCTTDEHCHKLEPTMKCVSGWCTCRDNAPYVNRCLYGKSIGQGCLVSDECSAAGGFCNDSVCTCYSNTVEFKGECYKGYKALLNEELILDMRELTELTFWVSDEDEEYQIHSKDPEADYTYDFNELDTWSTDSQNQVSMRRNDEFGEVGLCAILYNPTSKINRIISGGLYFEMAIFTYDEGTDSFDELCDQVNGMLFLDPTVINVTRTGDQATADIEFHPLSHDVELVTGFLSDSCSDDDDCKPLGSECDGGSCQCDDDHVEVSTNCCVPKVDSLSSGCSAHDQCTVPNAVCSGKSTCDCRSGYEESGGACVASS